MRKNTPVDLVWRKKKKEKKRNLLAHIFSKILVMDLRSFFVILKIIKKTIRISETDKKWERRKRFFILPTLFYNVVLIPYFWLDRMRYLKKKIKKSTQRWILNNREYCIIIVKRAIKKEVSISTSVDFKLFAYSLNYSEY